MIIGLSGKIGSGKDTVCKIMQYLTLDPKVFSMDIKDISADVTIGNGYCGSKSKFVNKKFAYKLKQMCGLLSGKRAEDFENQALKDSSMGEEWRLFEIRTNHADYLNAGFKKYFMDRDEANKWIITNIHQDIHRHFAIHDFVPTYRWLLQNVGTEAMRNMIHPNAWVNALFADYGLVPEKVMNGDYSPPDWIITDVRFPNEAHAIKARGGKMIRVDRFRGKTEEILSAVNNHPSETALDDYKHWDYEIDNNGTMKELIENVRKILIIEKII